MEKPLCIDLFAGGGGFTMGFEKAGYKVLGYEKEKEIQENAKRNGLDIRKADIFDDKFIPRLKENIAGRKVTVIVGGPPCQSFSAGNTKGKGEKDERNGIDHFLSIVNSVRPTHFIMENAPTLLGEKHSDYFTYILKKIKGMGYNYNAEVVDMSYFRVPQKRKRTIIFGTLDDRVFNFFSLNHLTATQMPVEEVLTREEIESVKILGYGVKPSKSNFNNTNVNSENDMSMILHPTLDRMRAVECRTMRNINIKKPSNTLTITSCKGASIKGQQNTAARFLLWRKKVPEKKVPGKWNLLQCSWIHPDDLLKNAMRVHPDGLTEKPRWKYEKLGFPTFKNEREKEWAAEEYKNTLFPTLFPEFKGDQEIEWTVRGVTVHEMRRIQTFPDAYIFHIFHDTSTPKTRKLAETIIGNSVPPNFAYVLASRLLMKKDEEIMLGTPITKGNLLDSADSIVDLTGLSSEDECPADSIVDLTGGSDKEPTDDKKRKRKNIPPSEPNNKRRMGVQELIESLLKLKF